MTLFMIPVNMKKAVNLDALVKSLFFSSPGGRG
jgi:hypothetical protein